MTAKLSIIIPVYNAEDRLRQCLDSVIQQNFAAIEIILVDDGSQDRSLDICHEYATADSRIVVLSQSNSGVSSARNRGIRQSSGEYLAFVDADDEISPDTYEVSLKFMQEQNLDIISFGISFDYFKHGELIFQDRKCISDNLFMNRAEIKDHFFKLFSANYLSSVCNKVFKRAIIEENQILFDGKMAIYEDLAFVLDAVYVCSRFGALAEPYYHYFHNMAVYHLGKRPDIDYMGNFRLLSERFVKLTEDLGMESRRQVSKTHGIIFRFYLIGVEKMFASNAPATEKYTYLKSFYGEPRVRDAAADALCSGFRLNAILFLFRHRQISIAFLLFYLNNLYLTGKMKLAAHV